MMMVLKSTTWKISTKMTMLIVVTITSITMILLMIVIVTFVMEVAGGNGDDDDDDTHSEDDVDNNYLAVKLLCSVVQLDGPYHWQVYQSKVRNVDDDDIV